MGFKYRHKCDSNTCHVFILQLYQGHKTTNQFYLVLDLLKNLRDSHCYIFFDKYFNNLAVIQKLDEQNFHGCGTNQGTIRYTIYWKFRFC